MVRKDLVESALKVKRVSDRLIAMTLEVKGSILNIVSAHTPQVGNSMEEKNTDLAIPGWIEKSVSQQERIVLGADLNGHVNEGNIGMRK